MSSKRKIKGKEYLLKIKEWDRKFEELNLTRPQDQHDDLMKRMRQINLGVTPCQENINYAEIMNFAPEPVHLQPRMDFKSYPYGKPDPHWVDTSDKFDQFMHRLLKCTEFSIDLEVHGHRTFTDFVCLIQIGTWEYGDYLIDPFKVRDKIIKELKPVLESPKPLKIGHDLTNDTRWLQKNFEIFMVAAMDTQIMHEVLTGKQIGFKDLVIYHCPDAKKLLNQETMSDWRLRPGHGMTTDQELYATNDVHILLRVFDKMRYEMKCKADSMTDFLVALENSKAKLNVVAGHLQSAPNLVNYRSAAENELKLFSNKKQFPGQSGLHKCTDKQKGIFAALLEWRDLISRIIDEKPNHVLDSSILLKLAKLEFPTVMDVKRVLGSVDSRISDPATDKSQQAGVIRDLIISHGDYIVEMRNIECHNCLKTGHGPAWACPFDKIKENYKLWYNRPENETSRSKQFHRRRNNMIDKMGLEKADKAIQKTKLL